MSKLTVAEASRHGYGTGLAILQAVQKNWLHAEKGADGQWLVDAGDLVALFGRPSGPERTPGQAAPIAPADALPAADDTADLAGNGGWVADAASPDAAGPDAAGPDAAHPDDDADTAEPAAGRGDSAPASAVPPVEADSDIDALHARIAELRAALAAERRRTAALVDVLANRVLPAAGTPRGDDDASPPADNEPPAEAIAAASATGIVAPARIADDDPAEGGTGGDVPGGADAPGTFGVIAPDDTVAPPPPTDADVGVPPWPTERGIDGDPPLAADVKDRPVPRRRPEPADAGPAAAFVWQLWALVTLVWIGLIGAVFWYVADLGPDLWVLAQWLRGERAADTPDFVDAAAHVQRAVRDIFGPPAALFVVLAVVRGAVRALRR